MSYYHDSTRTILDDVMYETTKDLGMAQGSESEDQDDTGNVQGYAEESYGHIQGTEKTTSQPVENDSCVRVCPQTEAHARERQLHAGFNQAPDEKGDIEGHEHHVHNKYEQDVDDPGENYQKMMEHIDDVLLYIDRSIERNTLSMTILRVTTMIGFTVLSGLMLLTWNIVSR